MTREEIISFLNANQMSFLATVENGEPRVRGMMMYRADDQGLLFHTGEFKDLAKQLHACPKAEVCVFNPESGVQVRVRGNVEFITDKSLKDEIINDRPFLKPIVEAVGYDAFAVFRIKDCLATVWTMATNAEPNLYIKL